MFPPSTERISQYPQHLANGSLSICRGPKAFSRWFLSFRCHCIIVVPLTSGFFPPSTEELSSLLARKFASKCFDPLELYSFKDNFKSLAEAQDGTLYWSEDTLIRFLALPPDVGSVIFQLTSYLAAFPFPSLAPAILDFEGLVKAVAIVTGRHRKALRRKVEVLKLLFRALAVHERVLEAVETEAVDSAVVYDSDDSEDLSLAALDALDAIDVYNAAEKPSNVVHTRIPMENLRKLVAFLIAIAPLEDTQPLAEFAPRFGGEAGQALQQTADCVLRAFGDGEGGAEYRKFRDTVRGCMPHLFSQGLPSLFNHFLFSKNVDGHTPSDVVTATAREPLLVEEGEIMTLNALSQLSLFIKGERLWRRVRPLYTGSEDGFSMGNFETKVLKWNAPTILLISGTLLSSDPAAANARERAFTNLLPPRRLPSSSATNGTKVTYGAFLEAPWKHAYKGCFGDANTVLFQLSPVHRVFRASTQSHDYTYFNRDDGVGFGTPPQGWKNHHRPSPYFNIGPVSLVLDHALEFGVFTCAGGGGAFLVDNETDGWQDRFEIDAIEVWGCGGESEAEAQRKAWQWEEREALLRRQINLGKDIEADRVSLLYPNEGVGESGKLT